MADEVTNDTTGTLEAKVEKDEFSEAFDVAQGMGENADLTAADDPAKMKEEEPPAETPPVTPPVEAVIPPAEQQPGESDEKYEQRYKTLQGIHKHDRETWETEKATLLTQLEEAKKPKEPTKEEKAVAEAFIDSLTDEQKVELRAYEQDFDVVSKMEGIKRGVEMAKLRKEMQAWREEVNAQLAATSTSLNTRIDPVVKMAEENERDTHFSMIREGYDLEDGTHVPGHSDFEKFRDDGSLLKWIESKPKYLQPALKEAYSQGAAADVIDLISDFKKDNNLTQAPPDNVVQMNRVAKKQALTSVTTRRGAVNVSKADLSDDFEGAFDEALNK